MENIAQVKTGRIPGDTMLGVCRVSFQCSGWRDTHSLFTPSTVHPPIYPSTIFTPTHLSTTLLHIFFQPLMPHSSTYPPTYILSSIHPTAHPSTHLQSNPFIPLSTHPSICPSIHLSIYPSIIHPFILSNIPLSIIHTSIQLTTHVPSKVWYYAEY